MGIGTIVGKTAIDLTKSDNIQNKAVGVMGMLFPYAGLTKKALDMYLEEIEKADMSAEAKVFLVVNAKKTIKKIKNQKDIAEIAIENAREGTDFSDKSGVDEEWLERFMDSAGFVSSDDMKLVWGKILSNEFEKPGSTPPNMIRILSEFTPQYAKAFRTICSMRVLLISISEDEKILNAIWRNAVVYDQNIDYMRKLGLSFEIMNELETLGVIKFDTVAGYATTNMQTKKVLIYVNGNVLETVEHREDTFPIGNVLLTSSGEALSKITDPYDLESYIEAVKKYMESNSVIISDENHYNVLLSGDSVTIIRNNP